jgi:hypothetical protein
LTPLACDQAMAASMAALVPEMTSWPGALSLAMSQAPPVARVLEQPHGTETVAKPQQQPQQPITKDAEIVLGALGRHKPFADLATNNKFAQELLAMASDAGATVHDVLMLIPQAAEDARYERGARVMNVVFKVMSANLTRRAA